MTTRGDVTGGDHLSLESSTLDFEQADRELRKLVADLAEAAMCFANKSSGHLVVGVANRPGGGPR